MRITRWVLGIILFAGMFFGGVCVLQAGIGYEVKCKDPKCGFETPAGIGGGMRFEEAPGYCLKCQKWVAVSWKRGEKAAAPFATFWDPQTGEIRWVYKCPKCKQSFVAIVKIEDVKFCPKCKKLSLENKRTVFYD